MKYSDIFVVITHEFTPCYTIHKINFIYLGLNKKIDKFKTINYIIEVLYIKLNAISAVN